MNTRFDGSRDVHRATDRLARRLPEPLEDLAWIAYNYLWSWTPRGEDLFRLIDDHRFTLAGENPVRFLENLPERCVLDGEIVIAGSSGLDFGIRPCSTPRSEVKASSRAPSAANS